MALASKAIREDKLGVASLMRRLTVVERAVLEMTVANKTMFETNTTIMDTQRDLASMTHKIEAAVTRLQDADTKHSSGLTALAEHQTEALLTFKTMLTEQREAHIKALAEQRAVMDKSLADLTETLTTKALEQIQANMVNALFRRVMDWIVTMTVVSIMAGISYLYTHFGSKG